MQNVSHGIKKRNFGLFHDKSYIGYNGDDNLMVKPIENLRNQKVMESIYELVKPWLVTNT